MSMDVSHVINPSTLNNKFKTLVEYVEYKLLEWNNKTWSPMVGGAWKKDCYYVENKMQDFDQVVILEVEGRKWG
jgi:hypothetical protein